MILIFLFYARHGVSQGYFETIFTPKISGIRRGAMAAIQEKARTLVGVFSYLLLVLIANRMSVSPFSSV
jgi:hypothetical protein